MIRHDMIIVGSGPGACTAATEAAGLGLDVLLVEPERSCPPPVPPRLRQALVARLVEEARLVGSPPAGVPRAASWGQHVARAEHLARRYLEAMRRRLEHGKVQVRQGTACFDAPDAVRIGSGDVRRAPRVVIASGARPRRPSFFPFDDRVICDVASVFRADALPRSVTVVGASPEGCEMACLFAALGFPVILLDRRTRLLRAVDRDVLAILHARMQAAGIDVVLGEEIMDVTIAPHPREPHTVLNLASGRVEKCDRLVVCAGWMSGGENPCLDRAGVETDPTGLIVTDEFGCTSAPGVFAIGAVSGFSPDLGTEIYQARVAVNHALGRETPLAEHIPRTLFTIPEVAHVGLTDEACERLGLPCVVGVAAYPPVCARPPRDGRGLLKLVVGAEHRVLLGVHVIGLHASETLHLGMEFLRRGAAVDELASSIYASPSAVEAYRSAAVDAIERIDG